jgi:ADP-ribose pyrophosphatase
MEIVKKEIIYETRYLNFVATKYLNKDKKENIWYSAERSNGGKTVVVAAILNDKLVVTKEFRVAIADYEWGLPAGLVDGDELPADTAKRELKEETNLELVSIQEITPFLFNSAGMTNEVVSIVFCRAQGSVNDSGTEASEDIQAFLMDSFQVKELIQDFNKKISAKAYLIFKRFIEFGTW